ncbi:MULTISPECIES: MFS transporter [Pantoea]|uniref:MFS transporter, putative metabolite transport protein n=1 Tax=Candidatus Pantoea floridensis TaxID=1938870 RepID=A0A286BNW5_9GAMM|nr:MFS transporter [Pantoea floridensis]PIF22736.1 putative MFS transporter [Enterobacteriaceae bacterium JKS000233]SOD35849.1 MFS transporter, putative metabolite transport protein [Pantoea floridensis]
MTQTTLMDDVPLNRFHLKITGLTFGAHLTDGYILGSVGFALTQMTPQMALTPFWQGMIGSSALLGLFLGSLILGWIADTVGRQKIFCFSFILITLASGMQFFVESAEQLFLLRMLIGFGLGGDFAVGHTILAEFAPRKHRGVLLGAFSVLWTVGYVAASFVGHLALQTDAEGWRWLLASSALPAFAILLLRIGTPESPRWLLRRGRRDEAVKIVHRLFGPNVTLQEERQQTQDGSLSALFRPRYRRRTAFNCLFFVCLVIPYFAIYTFLPAILRQMGLDQGFATDLLLSGLLLVGAVLGIVLTALCSRRGFLIGSFVFLAACLLLLSLLHNSAGIWLIVLFAAFTLVMSAVSNLVGVFPAESFPTDVRSRGVGFATSMSRLGSAVGTLLLPLAIVNYGIAGTMALLAAILVLGALVSIAWAPETKGLTLTDASQETPAAEPTLNPPPSTSTQHL